MFQVRLLSGRTIRHLVRIHLTDPAIMLTASSGSNIWTTLVGTNAPNAQNRTDGNITLWNTSRPPAVRRRQNAVRIVATRATASGIWSRTWKGSTQAYKKQIILSMDYKNTLLTDSISLVSISMFFNKTNYLSHSDLSTVTCNSKLVEFIVW